MLRLNVRTKSKPEDVVKKAIEVFGPSGYGMEVTQQTDSCANFVGSGGDVNIVTCTDDKGTSVDLETHEWEYQVKEFADKIKSKRS